MDILLTILSYAAIILMVVVIFNILIIVHELGHFLAALWRGLVVEKFAVWFGKPIWKKEINGVEYILGSIPAGGYVALPQLAPMEALEGESKVDKEKLKEASPLDKIIVAFAGPLFSFGLALVFACIVWMVGKPVSQTETDLTVGYITEQLPMSEEEAAGTISAANPRPLKANQVYAEGLRTGDRVLEVDGLPVSKRTGMGESIMWRFLRAEGEKVPVTVARGGERVELELTPIEQKRAFYQRAPLRISPIPGSVPPLVQAFLPDSPADEAGLLPGDLIVGINGEPVTDFMQVMEQVWLHPEEAATYTIQRPVTDERGREIGSTVEFDVAMAPAKPLQYRNDFPPPMLGVQFTVKPTYGLTYPNPLAQVGDSVMMVVNTIDAVISPSSVGVSHLSGPAGIMNLYTRMLAEDTWYTGWRFVLWISVVINVNLALVNLLPLPVLDGGHITFAIIEWIRKRPVNIKLLEVLNGATALLLIGFMIYVTFFDLQDVFGGGAPEETATSFETPATDSSGP
ncbi:MAG: site-2 protease family protein [Verrucomicrobiota bacterium]